MSCRTYIASTFVATMAVIGPALLPAQPIVVWNASASVPIGLYRIKPIDRIAVGDLVAVRPPAPIGDFMIERGYVGRSTLLLKYVAGVPGQQICRIGRAITIDARPYGVALDHDRRGRTLPVWQGCRGIAKGEFFLMNRDIPDSFDGRYFGPIAARSIVGGVIPIYSIAIGDDRLARHVVQRHRSIERLDLFAEFLSHHF
ncbi:S26 family signal peptidase [Agrobacterium rhizogenes]|nr:S26 family signal peptidase [Rhizobium rhizogenes]NTJ77797.1 S26 family signal peptidase [Rhizobium rhizogenes]